MCCKKSKKKTKNKSEFRLPLDVLYSPSWEWHTKMSRESVWQWAGEAQRTGWTVLSHCASVSERPEPKTALSLSLSSSLGRYHESRRDRGRWVGYVPEARGINGANLQERCRGRKRGQPPGELKERRVTVRRRRRHCLRDGLLGTICPFSRTLENLVCFGVT